MMKKNLFVLLLALILPLSFVCAENYPYRSDVLWVTVPNHADWIYKTGEKATVEVQFYKYGIPQDGCNDIGFVIHGIRLVSHQIVACHFR